MEMLEISCPAQFFELCTASPPRSLGLRLYLVWGHNPHQGQGQLLHGVVQEQDPSFSFISQDTGARCGKSQRSDRPRLSHLNTRPSVSGLLLKFVI